MSRWRLGIPGSIRSVSGGGQCDALLVASTDRFAGPFLSGRARHAGDESEADLVRNAQRGSDEAIEQLFRLHWPKAWRAAYFVVHDSAAAEDIAQEAFLAAIRSLDRFDRRRPFGPWLHRIVVNRSIDWTRARTLRRETAAEHENELASPPTGGSAPLSDDIVAALEDLSPEQRALVVMRRLLEFTPGEIARALGLPRGTVNSRLRRALDRLGERLEEGGR
jgi:RNA polymerase sigma-70 factor (ECF subfamily)